MLKLSIFVVAASLLSAVNALGSSCTAALTPQAGANDPHWMQTITRRGKSAYNSNPSTYKVYRNVKDYGAKGDGVTDDTAAINAAISDQNRCGLGCASSTVSPGIIFFPSGNYLVTAPIIPFYFTQLVGDAKNRPTITASASFQGMAVIDADPYIPNGYGANYWTNQNNFFKSVRHFKIDLTKMPASSSATGLHWQVAQATTLVDVQVDMSTASGNNHQGIFMENGSGGFMSDLIFNGGKYGIWVGNQQFTVRNLTVNNAQTGVYASWNWGWTFQGVTLNNCATGFYVTEGGLTESSQTVGSETIIDAVVTGGTFVKTSVALGSTMAGSLLLDNIKLNGVTSGVVDGNGNTLLAGGSTTIRQWAQGNVYSGTSSSYTFVHGLISNAPAKPSALLDSSGRIYSRGRTDYPGYAASQFASVRAAGAVGDGVTDDTTAIQNFINANWGCKILFFDAGTYMVTNTITIPTGSIVVGEVWTTIIGAGANFANANSPRPVIKVGNAGDKGTVEISDMVFSARSGSAGAIVIEWNTADASGQKATAAMWDVHVRLGGWLGSGIQVGNCRAQTTHASTAACTAAFIGLHITSQASVYAEGTWVWTADHDLDDSGQTQIDVYTGRGIVSESSNGPIWFIGTASEHAAIVQYNFFNSKNVYSGFMQTETPYYQPNPAPPAPFSISSTYHDPAFTNGNAAWALNIAQSTEVFIYGGGFYSFFSNYGQDCLTGYTCQNSIVKVDSTSSSIFVYSVSTVGTSYMLNVDAQTVIPQSANRNGFASTFTIWTSTGNGGPVSVTTTATTSSASPSGTGTSGWGYLGCYADTAQTAGSPRSLTGPEYTDAGMTVEICESHCASGGYTYAGIEYGGECYCGNTLTAGTSTACTMPCNGNAGETCGGSWALSVFKVGASGTPTTTTSSAGPSSTGWTSLGCYADSAQNAGSPRSLTGAAYTDANMTNELCNTKCAGYTYAGVEYGQECYCGNTLTAGTSTACTMACPGNASETCGGSWALTVFKHA